MNYLSLNATWQKINFYLKYALLIIPIIILLIAFISPDLFISMTKIKFFTSSASSDFGRGTEGIVYIIRDAILFLAVMYSIICMLYELHKNKDQIQTLLPLLGLIIGIYTAADDTLFIHYNIEIGLLRDIKFSRFTVGITIFIMLSMTSTIREFIKKALQLEKAYIEKNSAFKVLHHSEERFRQLVDNINEAFVIYDYTNNVILYISPAFENIWGFSPFEFYEKPELLFNTIHEEDKKWVQQSLLPDHIKDEFEMEYRISVSNGSTKWVRNKIFAIRNNDNRVYRLALIIEDITERKESEEELTYIAYHDILTGLPNRRYFFERFYELIIQAQREKPSNNKALFFIDLDRFKTINDTMGHDLGDKLLKLVSSRLKQCIRKSDYLFRIGGDEFTIILNGVNDDLDSAIVAQKIIKAITDPFLIAAREYFLGINIGISSYPKDGDDVDTLVKNSDIALNEAKKERNGYRFFNEDMNAKALERMSIEDNLRYAIERNEFRLYYQPLVNRSGEIQGMEALIRWIHPDLGFIPPDKFISIAESTGQILPIGEWTFDTACRQIKKWNEMGFHNLKIAVNVSAHQFMDEKFVEKIESTIKNHQISSALLEIEITESSVMKDPEEATSKINRLNDMGISFSIDDFGTGYSSLSYLKRFKINYLKIDRSFVNDIHVDINNTEITKAIIAMAHNLQLKLIAEGVETKEQMDFLIELNCDLLQGYLFSKPVPADEFTKLLEKSSLV